MSRLTVLFPDFKGEVIQNPEHPFLKRLLAAVPAKMRLVPIVNGVDKLELRRLCHMGRERGFFPTGTTRVGLFATLAAGYEKACDVAKGPIVRLDTAEHPPEAIGRLLKIAQESDLVIGDLDFTKGGLVAGSADELTHLDIFPMLYREMTGGKVTLSCAHGFQVWSEAGECKAALVRAKELRDDIERQCSSSMTWGFDGAIVLGALAAGLRVSIEKVASETQRNRSRQKIATQYEGALRLLIAARKRFGW